jgi:hypothetical protein
MYNGTGIYVTLIIFHLSFSLYFLFFEGVGGENKVADTNEN